MTFGSNGVRTSVEAGHSRDQASHVWADTGSVTDHLWSVAITVGLSLCSGRALSTWWILPLACQAAWMSNKQDLMSWVVEALEELGGSGSVVQVSQVVWRRHEADLRISGELFYTWQYDIRWAATKLREAGHIRPVPPRSRGPWQLA
jgi:hypothetical protein